MWLRFVEAWLTTKLLQSQAFHNAVRRMHKFVHELRHGKAPEDMGGTNIDRPGFRHLLVLFRDEIKDQLRRKPRR